MSGTTNGGSGSGGSMEESSNAQRSQSEESLAQFRSSDQIESGTPSTSPSCWDIDDVDDVEDYVSPRPSQLFGRDTWKIEKFSEINKREVRGNNFEVGGYKWYILIYPQGCDVCNHMSLFLCVANYEKLQPGWSHFAQFTIAVVNKDPKKSKFSDTLHRFWKKEHDWGWKKFMELPKLQEGFLDDSGSLVINAQVQVIRDWVDRPFRCLFIPYRRELVTVYLTNVEQICWRFVEEKKSMLGRLIGDGPRWKSFCAYWIGLDQTSRRSFSRDNMDEILKTVVKHFFIEKEVTSTLVMDSLYCGLKVLEGQTRFPAPIVSMENDMFVLAEDALLLLQRAALEPLPPKYEKVTQNRTKEGNAGEEFNIKQYERRLTELGRQTVETFVLSHIFSTKIEVEYQRAISLQRQEQLIREEEEESWRKRKGKRGAAEKDKKSKKKQAKQKKNKNRGKEKRKEEKAGTQTQERDTEKEERVRAKSESSAEKPDTPEDLSDKSDSVDSSADIHQADSEDRESSPVRWETNPSEIHHSPPRETTKGRGSSISTPNGVTETKRLPTMDDNSNDSIRSGVANGSYKGNVVNPRRQKWVSNGKTQPRKVSNANSSASETEVQSKQSFDHKSQKTRNHSSEVSKAGESVTVVSPVKEPESRVERNPVPKDNTVPIREKKAAVASSPRAVIWTEKKVVSNVDAVQNKKAISARSPSSDQASPSRDTQLQTVSPRADIIQKTAAPKPVAQTATPMLRSLTAPIILPKQAPSPVISAVQTSTTPLARSVSSTGRLGLSTSSQAYIPQSYKHATLGSSSFNNSSSQSPAQSPSLPYSLPPPISVSNQSGFPINVSRDVSTGGLVLTGGSSSNRDATTTISQNHRTPVAISARTTALQIGRTTQSLVTDEFPHLAIINDLLEDEHGMMDNGFYYAQQQQFNNNNQYPYHGGDLGISGRSMSYIDDGYHQSYMPYSSSSSSSSPYGNRQMDELLQWRMANMDLSLLALGNHNDAAAATTATAGSYSNYYDLDSTSLDVSGGYYGYRDFRPSNGH